MDINHQFGNDLALGANGDLMPVDGTQRGQQRVLRRLLTNPQAINPDGSITPGDYAQHPDFGAGLGQFVGDLYDPAKVTARIRGQMLLEDCVAKSPEPQITVRQIDNGISCDVAYTDAATGQPVALAFDITR